MIQFEDKKKKKTGEGAGASVDFISMELDNSRFRQLGSWKAGPYK